MKSSRKYQFLIGSVFTLTFLSFQNCSGPGAGVAIRETNEIFSSINTDGDIPGVDPGGSSSGGVILNPTLPPIIKPSPVPSPVSSPSTTKYIQMTLDRVVQAQQKVDVLVVIDNSGSMHTEQSNMALRFNSFLSKLSGLDWQVGIVTTDVTTPYPEKSTTDGKLLAFNPEGLKVLNSSMPMDLASSLFSSTVQRNETGSKNERGIRAVYRALERAYLSNLISDQQHKTMFRDGAALSVVVVTDADETVPSTADMTKDSPYNLYNYVTMDLAKQFSFNSIIVKPNDLECFNKVYPGTLDRENEDFGVNYAELSRLSNGIVGSVCESDYSSQLAQMGQGVHALVNSIDLKCVPQDINQDSVIDISVVSNGQPVIDFNVNGSRVEFAQSLQPGTTTVTYHCLAK